MHICTTFSVRYSLVVGFGRDSVIFTNVTYFSWPKTNDINVLCRQWCKYNGITVLLIFTEVFTKLARNEIFHTKPATLHFEGFYVGKAQKKTLVCRHT